ADHLDRRITESAPEYGVQTVLRSELVPDRGGPLADAGDPPPRLAADDRGPLGDHGLMGAVERAQPEVNDADRQGTRIGLGGDGEVGETQPAQATEPFFCSTQWVLDRWSRGRSARPARYRGCRRTRPGRRAGRAGVRPRSGRPPVSAVAQW